MNRTYAVAASAALALTLGTIDVYAQGVIEHFDPKGQTPSQFTAERRATLRAELPFDDERDFEEQQRGFLAAPSYKQIRKEDGTVIWDMGAFEFLQEGTEFDSIHPSLQRQAILNMNYGLYEVVPDKIYQVRGYDLANITFIVGDEGWIIFDPLTTKETAKAALDFINRQLGERPVKAVVYSHSHIDHFGGVRGVADEEEVRAGRVEVIAPRDFLEHAVAENVYAGNAMTRRVQYQYANMLPKSPFGHVDSAIGKGVSGGTTGLIQPTLVIEDDYETHTIDGVEMIFQNTPGTEAPSEMNTYFPALKTFWAAENIVHSVHNIYTLRGALVRDALTWSRLINEALYRFGQDAEVMIASHNWPRWGNERIQEVMRDQRDAYANLNNQVLHYANEGVTINEIQNVYKVPESLRRKWHVRQYHGSEFHNSRAVINRYIGYWDGNPATLSPLSPSESAPFYVEAMGGADAVLSHGRALYDEGKYRAAAELVNKLVFAEPQNQRGKDLLADIFEQLGYQYESTSMRNVHLAAASELRNGIRKGVAFKSAGPDVIAAMTTLQWLEALGIRLDPGQAEDMDFAINLATPDNGEMFVVEVTNGTLTAIEGYQSPNAETTITVDRGDLNGVLTGATTLAALIDDGVATLEGNLEPFEQLRSALVHFDPLFEIMPGTKTDAVEQAQAQTSAFQQNIPYVGE